MAINNIDGIPFLWDNDAHLPLDERLKAWEQKFGNGQNSPLNSSSGFESLRKQAQKKLLEIVLLEKTVFSMNQNL
ncbi:MAG: hypothetical protein IPH74_05820 [Bacteroidetes bacterium]|nr:hypothetical protein [Bacteroidota bacterium]